MVGSCSVSVQCCLVEGLERYPRNVLLLLFQADFIHAYAELDEGNARIAIDWLETVSRSLSADELERPRYAKGWLQLATFQKSIGRYADARRNFELVLAHPNATDERKAAARVGLQSLPK